MPLDGDFDLTGLDLPAEDFAELMEVDVAAFRNDVVDAEQFLAKFGKRVPPRLVKQLAALRARLG